MPKVQRRLCRKWILIVMACMLAVGLGIGCAHFEVPVKNGNVLDENEQLREAFNQYWSYVAGKEVEETFAREAPHVQEMISEGSYRLYMNLFIKADLREVEILSLSCEQPFSCCIDCRMTYDADGKKVVRNLRDCWVRVGGDWYHIFRNPILFPQLGALDAGKRLHPV